jgi:hypothetical protein
VIGALAREPLALLRSDDLAAALSGLLEPVIVSELVVEEILPLDP